MATIRNDPSFCPALLRMLDPVLSDSSKHHDPLGTDHLSVPRFLIACQSRRKQAGPFPDDPFYDLPYGKYLSIVRDLKKIISIQKNCDKRIKTITVFHS